MAGNQQIILRVAVLNEIPTRKTEVVEETLLEGFEVEFSDKRHAVKTLRDVAKKLEAKGLELLDLMDDGGGDDDEDDQDDDD